MAQPAYVRIAAVTGAVAGLGGSAVLGAAPASGAAPVRQLAGQHGCVAGSSNPGCRRLRALRSGANSWALSPDQRSLYAVADSRSVLVLRRDARTGRLRQLRGRAGCVNGSGTLGCAPARAMPYEEDWDGPIQVLVSGDGESVYVLVQQDSSSHTVVSFRRDRQTGTLRQLSGENGCLSSAPGAGCRVAPGLERASSLSVDPEGKTVVAAGPTEIAVLTRDPQNGRLSAVSGSPNCFSLRARAGCHAIPAGEAARSYLIDVTFAPDGRSVSFTYDGYQSATPESDPGSLLTLARDAATGALRALPDLAGCLGLEGSFGPEAPVAECTSSDELHPLLQPLAFVDGDTAVLATYDWISARSSIFLLRRDPQSQGLLPTGAPGACWRELGPEQPRIPCKRSRALGHFLAGPVLSDDRRTVYLASAHGGRTPGHVQSFPVLSEPLRLGAPTSATWRARRSHAGPVPHAIQPSRSGRELYLIDAHGPSLRSFGLLREARVGRQRWCVGRAPGCTPARGLRTTEWSSFRAERVQLVESGDGRFLYVLGGHAAVFRLRK